MNIPSEKQLKIWHDEHVHRLKNASDDTQIKNLWTCYTMGDNCFPESSAPAPLLTYEMAYALHHKRLPVFHSDRTLVILVGESFHPLLQTIAAHQPVRLVGVVNRMYGDEPYAERPCGNCRKGKKYWELLYRCIQYLPAAENFNFDEATDLILLKGEEEERPLEVFQKLRDALRDDLANTEKEVVVDITGAKKTMVAGAFMLAAYTRAKISYVDSHLFDSGTPLGFSFHIRHLDNPLERLFLETWENIESAYKQYNFAIARQFLDSIQKELNDDHLNQLGQYLAICADWHNGQLGQAKNKWQALDTKLPIVVPLALEKIGHLWPTSEDNTLKPELFTDSYKTLLYAYDEIERIHRLMANHYHRDVFARAFALHETLLRARLLVYWQQSKLTVKVRYPDFNRWVNPSASDEETLAVKFILIQSFSSANILRILYALQNGEPVMANYMPQYGPAHNIFKSMKVERLHCTDKKNLKEQHDAIKDERNLITHSYYPVSSDLAQKAIQLAQDNLDDFESDWSNWQGDEPLVLPFPTWPEVKQGFELNMIPTKQAAANGR